VVISSEKKEQNDQAIEGEGKVFGSGFQEFRWKSKFIVFHRRRWLH